LLFLHIMNSRYHSNESYRYYRPSQMMDSKSILPLGLPFSLDIIGAD
jgi:hypothetical protein